MLKKNTFLLRNSLFLAAGMMLFSCGSETSSESESNADQTEAMAEEVEQEEDDSHTYILPSPLQIASMFKKSGLKYFEGFTNQQKDPTMYTTKVGQGTNLGIYNADLAYCVLNQQTQEALTYMNIAKQLSDQLGLGSIFEASSLGKRFEANLGNRDSLIFIIADLQMESDIYLDENELKYIASVVFAGAWIESVYLGALVYEREKSEVLSTKIGEQMTLLSRIIAVLNSQKGKDEGISPLIADLKTIEVVYDAFESVKAEASSLDEEPAAIVLTENDVITLCAQIKIIRTKFIENN